MPIETTEMTERTVCVCKNGKRKTEEYDDGYIPNNYYNLFGKKPILKNDISRGNKNS